MSSTVSSTVEQLEKNKVKLTIQISPEDFKKGLQYAYNRNKNSISIQGFRKGKAPRKVIEQYYGNEIFHEDAINHVLPDAYEAAVEEHNIEPVYRPKIEVQSMSEQDGAVFVAEVYVKPEVLVDEYYGLTYPIMETEPTEEDIDNRLKSEQEKNARTVSVDRLSEMGDILSINFTGYVDDEPFEGGHAEDYEITLGSKTFIDTFEDQLVGHAVGDDVDVNVTFPEAYGKEELSGKPALFKVEILEIMAKELPEVNDEFAQDVSEFETLQEFKDDIKNKIREEKEQHALSSKRGSILQQLVEKAEMDIPEDMYTARIEEMVEEMRYSLMQRGLRLEQYLGFSGMTLEGLKKNYEQPAKEDVEARLVLEAVSKKEQLETNDEEFKEHLEKILPASQSIDNIIENMSESRKKEVTQDILNQKALDFVLDKAVAMEAI
ncbi:MAG: trigger factor [Defluviitaleaceae bacterium]|nr:trigger factor [Defluviitaleaceae bacterium]